MRYTRYNNLNIPTSMADQKNLIDNIPDAKPVRVFLPLQGVKEKYRVNGLYQRTSPPRFSLLFQAGILPVDQIDTDQNCIVSIDLGGSTLSVETLIKEIKTPQALDLIVQKTFSPEQMRDFFRVDAVTSVIGKSFQPAIFSSDDDDWNAKGRTIDISGNGILASFVEPPPKDKLIRLEILLPLDVPETVSVVARPTRIIKVEEKHYDVAFEFEDILDEERDKIIGCCLKIQRRLLRLKVRVRNS